VSGVALREVGGTPHRDATILVVDDQSLSRDVIRIALESAGYDVLAAGSPSEAMALVRRAVRLDLVIADVVMPEMDAFELTQLVRRERPEVRVLFTSGYADAAEEGPFIRKPFLPSELLDTVDGLLSS
jgi:two-component system, cell cycle sensor histidine kinase and response regulator CckA